MPQEPRNREEARALRLAALDRQAVFASDSALALLRSATRIDPGYFPAHHDYWRLSSDLGRAWRLREEYRRRADLTPDIRECMGAVMLLHDQSLPHWAERFRALRQRYGRTGCIDFGLAMALKVYVPGRALLDEELDAARGAVRAFPELAEAREALLSTLERKGRLDDAIVELEAADRASVHVLERVALVPWRIRLLAMRGDTAAARRAHLAALGAARADGRAYVRFKTSFALATVASSIGLDARELHAQAGKFGSVPEARPFRVTLAITDAGPLVDAGRFSEALAILTPHVAYVAANDLPHLEMSMAALHGRALLRSGRAAEAIPILRRALEASLRVDHPGRIAEAHHQLAHAHETLGDWTSAAREADAFVSAAQRTMDPGVHVISYHDAAGIRWKAGWRAAADSLARMMVRVIERERLHYAYAAEYFERAGDPGRAAGYLRRALAPDARGHIADANVTYAALTRLHLALGQLDNARATARVHDSLGSTHDEILEPRVLAVMGQPDAAVAMMREWTRKQRERSNVSGQAKSLVGLASALLRTSPARALEVAREAESLALRHNLVAERLDAARIAGQASADLRKPNALQLLRHARDLARAHPDAVRRVEADLALAEALASLAQRAEAGARFADVVALVEQGAGSLTDDVSAARFRAARVRAFDGALRNVLATAAPVASNASGNLQVNRVLQWSARKKGSSATDAARGASVAALQARLRTGEAFVDYVSADDSLWAVLVTPNAARAIRLPLSGKEVERLGARILRPFTAVYDGRIDLARVPFDREAAVRLYDGLLRPLEPVLAGATHLIIVPDGFVHAIPFDALVTSPGHADAEYVLDRWVIRYAPATVAGPRARATPLRHMLLVAGNAPGAELERRLVGEAWRGRLEVLEGAAATEGNLVRRARGFDVLHVASHAVSSARDPLASHLELRGDDAGDGLLHYNEILEAGFSHALVVLNACETSHGELLAGSGFMSLARAFLAGSAAVVATRWPVGSAAAPLAQQFYTALGARGARAADALHAAKLALRGDPPTAHPFFWASHVLVTDRW